MSVTDAIKNQVVGSVLRAATGNLTKVQGNLPGRARRGPIPGNTGGIEAPGAASINLSYPLNVEDDEQQGHYIMFMINESTAGKVAKKLSKDAASMADMDNAGIKGNQGKKFIDTNLNAGGGTGKATMSSAPRAGGLHQVRPSTTRMIQAITLYMPPSVRVSYKSGYKDQEIGTIAGGLSEAIQAFSGGKGFMDTAGKTATAVGPGLESWAAATVKAAAETAAPGAAALAQISAGAILGSKMEVLFTNVGRRDFSFTFIFIPKSEKEAKMIHNITQTFKKHMLPEYLSSVNLAGIKFEPSKGRLLKIPDTFDIMYFYRNNENPFLNRISTCYLTSMDIVYGGDKYITYEPTMLGKQSGPPPQRTSISLSFTEIEIITRDRAEQGF